MIQALATKLRIAASLLKSNPAIFGVGVGQSLDNPSDAALMLFIDEKKFTGNPGELPQLPAGLRVRVIRMDRLHVTRSHETFGQSSRSCHSGRWTSANAEAEPAPGVRSPNLFEDVGELP
jgi:hypothetical protein